MQLSSIAIDKNWSFTQVGGGQGTKDGEWVPVANFPTTVHVELLKLGRIPDPVSRFISPRPDLVSTARNRTNDNFSDISLQFVGLNEWEVQCRLPARRLGI